MKSTSGEKRRDTTVLNEDGHAPAAASEGEARDALLPPAAADGHSRWRFVTNHARVLETIAHDPTIRLRDVALLVGITERTATQIVDDFVRAGYLTKTRNGRRNRYKVHHDRPLRHPQHQHRTVGDLLRFLQPPTDEPGGRAASPRGNEGTTPTRSRA